MIGADPTKPKEKQNKSNAGINKSVSDFKNATLQQLVKKTDSKVTTQPPLCSGDLKAPMKVGKFESLQRKKTVFFFPHNASSLIQNPH